MGRAQTRRQTMRVMVFVKAAEDSKMDGTPTAEELSAAREGTRGKLGVA